MRWPRLRTLLVGGAGLAALAGTVPALRLAPWLEMPDEPSASIDRHWQEVLGWAHTGPVEPERPELVRATRLARPAAGRRSTEADPLTEAERDALLSFDAWSQIGAPIAVRDGEAGGLAIFELAKLVVRSSSDVSDLPRIEACARLGAELRTRRLLVDAVMGYAIAQSIAEWSRTHGIDLGLGLDRYRPVASDLHGALAREARFAVSAMNESFGKRTFAIERPPRSPRARLCGRPLESCA